jgi:Icc-related predicted phosphoesterase
MARGNNPLPLIGMLLILLGVLFLTAGFGLSFAPLSVVTFKGPGGLEVCVFNLHCPPYRTVIDSAPKLDETLKPVVSQGHVVMTPAGSTAVRDSIKKYQTLMDLHGHIHESKGMTKIGRTKCFNPGSEYREGVLRGLLLDLEEKGIKSYLFTSG